MTQRAYEKMRKRAIELLRDIRDGNKHTKANRVLAPLAQFGLITYKTSIKPYKISNVRLTSWGKTYLRLFENELLGKNDK